MHTLADLVPDLAMRATHLLNRSEIRGHRLVVTQGLRTYQEQDALYAQGRTKPGKVVTWARGGESWHNFGRALDVAFLVDGSPSWNEGLPWESVGMVGEAVGLEWGGRNRGGKIDRPHFQFRDGLTLAQARVLHPRTVRL